MKNKWYNCLILGLFVALVSCNNAQQNTFSKTLEVPASEVVFEGEDQQKTVKYKGENFTGIVNNYFKNGDLHFSTHYKNGIKEGEWKIWYSHGKLHKVGNTLNGKEDGIYQEFYPSGQLKYEYFYKNGLKVDTWRSWYENGVQWTSRDFKNDILEGKVLVWDTTSVLTKEYVYRNGNIIDQQFYFEK